MKRLRLRRRKSKFPAIVDVIAKPQVDVRAVGRVHTCKQFRGREKIGFCQSCTEER